MSSEPKAKLAVLASGGGSNADKICWYFKSHPDIRVELIIANRNTAGVFNVASTHGIETAYLPKHKWDDPVQVLALLHAKEITHIVLAGFLLQIPDWLIQLYEGRIINIHPSLLPKHGGKGMYGHHVHEAVKQSGELISGITIHEVNEHYDEGKILFQKEVSLNQDDTSEDIARKVLTAEHVYYSQNIEKWILAQGAPA